jgi:hypothetical protein
VEEVIGHKVNVGNGGVNFRQCLAVVFARECGCADRGAEHDDAVGDKIENLLALLKTLCSDYVISSTRTGMSCRRLTKYRYID